MVMVAAAACSCRSALDPICRSTFLNLSAETPCRRACRRSVIQTLCVASFRTHRSCGLILYFAAVFFAFIAMPNIEE